VDCQVRNPLVAEDVGAGWNIVTEDAEEVSL